MDMLVRLFDMPPAPAAPRVGDIAIRKPLAPEHELVAAWICEHFAKGWSSEARASLANRPISMFISTQGGQITGFCCYDAIARGFVGPIGVLPEARRSKVGGRLLRTCLDDMRSVGYAYAIVGMVGEPEFFARVAGATEIAGSGLSIYRGMLRYDGKPPVS
jgi:predicted N-acetyltransferase YhbS